MSSRSDSEELGEQVAALSELHALLRRVELEQLEASDWPKVKELFAKYIEEAEAAGLEDVVLELPDREPGR